MVATGRSALIAAIGVVLGFAGPSYAASSADDAAARPIRDTHHYRHHASVRSTYVSQDTNAVYDASGKTSVIPPSVANANAQLRSSDTPVANAEPAAAAETMPASPPDAQPAAMNPMVAAAEAPAAREAPVQPSTSEHSIWDETSLIGKIFIGFGALLTIASAARMFMA
jgi:hypothetical protein